MRNRIIIAIILFIIVYATYSKCAEGFESTSQRWAVLQYDNRILDNNFEELVKRNRAYAKKHDYEYVYKKTGYDYITPYWTKVKIVKELMRETIPGTKTHRYKGILWLDTDAVIIDQKKSLDDFFTGGNSFIACPDPPSFLQYFTGPFNAGVWAVKNDKNGREIVNEWMEKYDSKKWFLEKGKWKTRGTWAGVDYEQGAFSKHILPKYKRWIKILPWYVFQARSDERSTYTFTIHFAAGLKEYIPDFIRSHPFRE